MSETKRKNRIDNNLKLEIPKNGENLIAAGLHPMTAPAANTFGNHRFLPPTSWNQNNIGELHKDGYFEKSPSSASASAFNGEKTLSK